MDEFVKRAAPLSLVEQLRLRSVASPAAASSDALLELTAVDLACQQREQRRRQQQYQGWKQNWVTDHDGGTVQEKRYVTFRSGHRVEATGAAGFRLALGDQRAAAAREQRRREREISTGGDVSRGKDRRQAETEEQVVVTEGRVVKKRKIDQFFLSQQAAEEKKRT